MIPDPDSTRWEDWADAAIRYLTADGDSASLSAWSDMHAAARRIGDGGGEDA